MLLAKDTRDGIGCDNMTAIFITLKWMIKYMCMNIDYFLIF